MELKNKDGRLTRYGLACGHIERKESEYEGDNYRSVTLKMDGSVLLVNCYNRELNIRESFGTNKIKDARRVYARKCREYAL